MVDVNAVLRAESGHVIAPAGCGKTELIAGSVAQPTDKPALILTHTTAGVAALRLRLKKGNIPPSHYRLNTIAGWALNLISMFPERAGYTHDPLEAPNYSRVQAAIGELCSSGNIHSELRATYSRLLVDEYQDCSVSQHSIVSGISTAIPTVVFGDPMQAVFGFGNDPLPNWNTEVVPVFPEIGRLVTPWRWNNANASDLGQWLLVVRETLVQGQRIDLRTCPARVTWHQLTDDANANITAQIAVQYEIARRSPGEAILTIGDSIQATSRHNYASRVQGVSVVEPVDCRDVVGSADQMDGITGLELLQSCLDFLVKVMTNVYGDLLQTRVQSILANRNRTPPTEPELTAIALYQDGGYNEAVAFLSVMAADTDRRVYRNSAFNIMLEALRTSGANPASDLNSTIAGLREQRRHSGRIIPAKAVGSTLLLKGFEADHVLILDADRPGNTMSREHLYVALTRGAKSVHVFSRNCILP